MRAICRSEANVHVKRFGDSFLVGLQDVPPDVEPARGNARHIAESACSQSEVAGMSESCRIHQRHGSELRHMADRRDDPIVSPRIENNDTGVER